MNSKLSFSLMSVDYPFRIPDPNGLESGEGVEIKASMRRGGRFVFTWTTDGDVVDFDMHGEAFNATDDYTSYWKEEAQSSASRSLEAPFDGLHGWFWQNLGPDPATIRVTTSGFLETRRRQADGDGVGSDPGPGVNVALACRA